MTQDTRWTHWKQCASHIAQCMQQHLLNLNIKMKFPICNEMMYAGTLKPHLTISTGHFHLAMIASCRVLWETFVLFRLCSLDRIAISDLCNVSPAQQFCHIKIRSTVTASAALVQPSITYSARTKNCDIGSTGGIKHHSKVSIIKLLCFSSVQICRQSFQCTNIQRPCPPQCSP